ncbi:hypothetical protein Hanom_Chr02g00177691 [Helianthus anomalus]
MLIFFFLITHRFDYTFFLFLFLLPFMVNEVIGGFHTNSGSPDSRNFSYSTAPFARARWRLFGLNSVLSSLITTRSGALKLVLILSFRF